ncbi:MAG: hypothetical protein LUD76_05990 [Alistipes sp.]|nr:hypothetical protein [Alistipes sp.]
MKLITMLLFCCLGYITAQAQVYKIDEVWSSAGRKLVCRKDASTGGDHRFYLFDVKNYNEGSDNPFLSVYFEGTSAESAAFMAEISDFAERFAGQDGMMTAIAGRNVFRVYRSGMAGVYIFEPDGRHFGGYSDRDIDTIQQRFEEYCKKENII